MKNIKKIVIALFAIFPLVLSNLSIAPGVLAKEDYTIGLALSTTNNPFFVDLQKGVEEAAKEMGATVQVVDAQDDATTQLNGLDDLMTQGVDILLINPVDSDAIVPAIKNANEADIPVITIDRNAADGEVVSLVASNNVEGGKMAAEFIIEKVGEGSKVIQLEGVPGASATNERGEGFEEGAKDKLDIIASQSANFNRSEGLTVMENLLQAHPDVKAVFAQNDEMALGAIEAIKAAGLEEDVLVVGFDGNDDGLEAVKEGELAATIAQQPKEMGRLAVEAAINHLNEKEVEESIASPLELVTKDTLEEK
ncbi:ribose ABC transporter substrate-binding protein RbsB [Facklamia miroungae]|uniref:Ribose transport system substrate-binding protein n=1 Tax=Facklamia miroungae TaxID=120956 RepID=A0A1G7QBR9_9LACT|nr:ribose ABC transporter substrate-binding protein RbsB [Facklamia miroungae]NKZ28890.1 ribose ABC transporter substrate-binding protein RbsB [Facklamia miroungae]SDF95898.1 ribose transport system substrate-binding protein [Facklamia miroungae]